MFRNSFGSAPSKGAGNFRMFLFLWVALIVFGVVGVVTGAKAQRFPGSCCGEYDCLRKPVPRHEIERRDDGWFLLKERVLIPFDQVRPSPDDGVYICRTEMGHGRLISPPNEKPCLFMPESDG
jgi:hypothetical protein